MRMRIRSALRKHQGKTLAFADRDFTQMVVPEPSFTRGVASIADLRGALFVVDPKGKRARTKSTAQALRADRKRIVADFADVRPPRKGRHGVGQLPAYVEAASES